MAKRHMLALPLLCLCALSAFPLSSDGIKRNSLTPDFSLSAGGRIFYNGMFNIWEYSYTNNDAGPAVVSVLESSLFSNNGFGIGGFFDAAYLEIGMDLIFGAFKPNARGYTGDFEMNSTQFGFTLLGKFPFAAGPVTVFPLAGIDYQIFLSGEANGFTIKRDDMSGSYQDMFDAFSLVVGAGLDYNITDKLYLRGELLANFKLESDFERELKRLANANQVSFSLFTFGPRISAGIGYRFGSAREAANGNAAFNESSAN
jgi:outer membrane protein W